MESLESLFKEHPLALTPIYFTGEPNQPIQLYQGSLKISQEGTVYEGNGTVFFEWLPSPDVKFLFSKSDNESLIQIELGKGNLNLSEIQSSVEVGISSVIPIGFENQSGDILGNLNQPIILRFGHNLSHLLFHLTNFHQFSGMPISTSRGMWRGRLILEAENWNVFIDRLENLRDIIKSLELKGGYAITHVGKLERSDKKPFTTEEADDVLKALHWFLSFSRGFRTSLILLVGYDNSGKKLWENCTSYTTSPCRSIHSWFADSQDSCSLSKLFPGFLNRWRSTTWNQPIRFAIHWYLESIAQAGAVQGSIVLMQAAFEILAWTLLVEEKGIISQQGFEKLAAADQLRLLLSQCSVPLKVPDSLTDLLKASKELNWVDGAQALTEIRNAIVHPNPKKRQKYLNRPFPEQIDAYKLGLWYLELILLNLFEYKGDYFNRITNKEFYQENIEAVPWVKK
ncbi:hypothetical protein H6G97_15220 [Nostoc flagelliforme FACHB-838]|uniref:YopA central domain-containing protein n=1 Tax=Nostoc flagelliforme FACHB-838 TaxID=2692904 RepID=A0ABR8DPM0_9NOSO|nr:hypothetical protein [Nostoc flagelliforme]MBD2530855.1 hypothetical protein [Nostoc flagelliforme FACHB-838]